jgi:hypothetical protein
MAVMKMLLLAKNVVFQRGTNTRFEEKKKSASLETIHQRLKVHAAHAKQGWMTDLSSVCSAKLRRHNVSGVWVKIKATSARQGVESIYGPGNRITRIELYGPGSVLV